MAKSQKIIPANGMDLSIDESYIPESMARFIKGWTLLVNNNQSNDNDGGLENGANAYVFTPEQSNELFKVQSMPIGINKCIHGGYVTETNRFYSCIWNSNDNHSIWQLDGKNRTAIKVIETSCLEFIYDAKHFITQTRFNYATYDYFDKNSNVKKTKTWIFITDDNSRTKQINVEDAIATNGFTTPSNFFTQTDCCDICTMITMGSPAKPIGCIEINPIPRPDTPEEKIKPNVLNFRTWQFRLKAIDVWGRESIHGVISKQYYNSPSTSCNPDELKYPRLLDLSFDAGCKWIASYQLEYRNCGVGNSEELKTDWKAYQIIDKYSDCDANGIYKENFWERTIYSKYFQLLTEENNVNYNQVTNLLTIRFSGDKETKGIPNSETSINQNYIANKSNSLFKLGNKIGVANNERGFNPLLCAQKDAIRFNLLDESNADCNILQYRKVTIWGYIFSPLDNKTTNIRFIEPTSTSPKETIAYGQAGQSNGVYTPGSAKDNPYYYEQYFSGINHFVMYAVGHKDIYAIGKQYDISDPNNPIELGVMANRDNGTHIIQKWEFVLPAGKYVLAMSAPKEGLTKGINDEELYRNSSANMIGLTSLSNPGVLVNEQYEIYVDCVNGDFELKNTPIMIWDLTRDIETIAGNLANAISTYAINKVIPTKPIGYEMADVVPTSNSNGTIFQANKTDRNGHIFGTTKGSGIGGGVQLQFELILVSCVGSNLTMLTDSSGGSSEYVNTFNAIHTLSLTLAKTFKIRGSILDCAPSNLNNPIEGVVVVLQNGRSAITNSLGEYEIISHFNRQPFNDKLIINNSVNGCVRTRCDDDCSIDFDVLSVVQPATCSGLNYDIPAILLKSSSFNFSKTILQGKYGLGIVLEDCLGMETFVQANDGNYVDILDTSNINQIEYDLNGLSGLSGFKYLSFYITENLTYEDWMEWVIDYLVLEDNNGNIGASLTSPITDPKRLRIYINSLVAYTAYSQSNTSWQFLKGDLIQFFQKGNGDKINVTKIVNYRAGENYVTVEYDNSMNDLYLNQIGLKIRLLRPRLSNQNEQYFQLCEYIKIENGIPTSLNGVLNFSNVYRLQRSIPVYENVITNQLTTINLYDTQGNVVGTKEATLNVSIPTPNNKKNIYALNHHSPSDFWGNKCWGRGRVNVKNPYERKHRFATEISLSNGISSEGLTNYLHWFTTLNSTSFDEQVYHSITAVLTGQNIVLAICTNDYFTLLYDQNEVIVDSKTGTMYANSTANKFGKPRTKVGDDYGCSQNDINTIRLHNGFVFYLDSQRSTLVRHNFEQAEDFTPLGLKGWLQEKIHTNSKYNLGTSEDKHKQFISIICPKINAYILTSFKLDSGDNEYINNKREVSLIDNETISVDIIDPKRKLNGMLHFTPEMYGYLLSDEMGVQLLSFKNGLPYIHYPIQDSNSNVYLNYYGTQCKRVLEVICNLDNVTDKNFLYIETFLKQHQLYIDRIITESKQESRLMPKWWSRTNNSWAADFKCQTNGIADTNLPNNSNQNSILDGATLFGKWIKIRFVTKDIDDSKYAELNSIEVFFGKLGK
jgi:hypothetical protein